MFYLLLQWFKRLIILKHSAFLCLCVFYKPLHRIVQKRGFLLPILALASDQR